MEITIVTYALLILNVFQFLYWSRQVQKLIDKLMSRSFFEYNQITKPKANQIVKVKSENDETITLGEFQI